MNNYHVYEVVIGYFKDHYSYNRSSDDTDFNIYIENDFEFVRDYCGYEHILSFEIKNFNLSSFIEGLGLYLERKSIVNSTIDNIIKLIKALNYSKDSFIGIRCSDYYSDLLRISLREDLLIELESLLSLILFENNQENIDYLLNSLEERK